MPVTYLDTGIILKIVPRVGQNGAVDMQIDQEISSVVPDASGSTTGSLTPTISKRRITSDITVKSGQNVLLAGLVTDTRSKSPRRASAIACMPPPSRPSRRAVSPTR